MLERIIKYLSVITIAVFILSYAFLNGYYSVFGVDIINFITTSEIFYTLLPLAIFMLTAGTAFFGWVPPALRTPEAASNQKKKRNWSKILIILIIIIVVAIVGIYINDRYYPHRDWPLVNLIALSVMFTCAGYAAWNEDIERRGFYPYIIFTIFSVMGYLFISYGKSSAKITKKLGSEINIVFKYHNSIYSSSDSLIFVGETQSTLFLYRVKDSSTWVLSRNSVDSLVILDK